MTPADFARWRKAMSLNRTQAAEALGVSRNMPAKYEAGTFRLVVRESSYGLGEFYSLEDDHGVIEVANSHEDAVARIKQIEGRLAA